MTKKIKYIIIPVLLLASSILTGFWWTQIPQHPWYAFLLLIDGIVWIIFALLADNTHVHYLWAIASIACIGFFLGFEYWTLIGIVLGSIFVTWSLYEARWYKNALLTISVKNSMSKSVRIYFTALALLFSLSYFGTIISAPNAAPRILPQDVFRIVLRIIEPPLQSLAPGITAESSLDETIAVLMHEQLKKDSQMRPELVPTLLEIKKIIPSQRKDIIRAVNKELGIALDINTPGNTPLSAALYQVSTQKINNYTEKFSTYVPLLVSVGFFLSLKTVSVVFSYAAIMLAALFIELLLRVGIIKKELIAATKEQLI